MKFIPHTACYQSNVLELSDTATSKTRTMKAMVKSASMISSKRIDQQFLDHCMEESIRVHCYPYYGGRRWGKCITGDKSMSLRDEKAYNKFAENLTFSAEVRILGRIMLYLYLGLLIKKSCLIISLLSWV